MNPYWEKDKSLTSRTHVLPKGEVTAVASNSIRRRQGILESTPRIYDGYEDMDACRKPNARVQSYPSIIKEMTHGRGRAAGRLHGGRSSSARAVSGRPPLQPHSRRRMSGGPSSVSPRESHRNPGVGEAPQRGSSAFESLQQRDYKWNLGSGALNDRPPSQPFICHRISGVNCASTKEYHTEPILEEPRSESSIRRPRQSDDSRWSSGSRATFDMAPFQALAGSSIRSLKQSDDSSWNSGYRSA
jgi:hypothetical protein